MLLGAIADDLTGATDLALMLARGGMRTVQVMGVPEGAAALPEADAVVVALKSRTIPAAEAVAQSLVAAAALRAAGARQLFFKYCSTFDSTDAGNIGPVAAALIDEVGGDIAVACPAFPANGRTVYMGQLFVNGVPLAESPMKDHPLTPMRDSDLVRVLSRQLPAAARVGLVDESVVAAGGTAIAARLAALAAAGCRFAVVDAISDADLLAIAEGVADAPLVTGGSGIALGIPENFRRAGLLPVREAAAAVHAPAGRGVILAGSCSAMTRRQVAAALAAGVPAMRLDPVAVAEGRTTVADAVAFVRAADPAATPLLYSSAEPEAVRAAQAALGTADAGAVIERFLAEAAAALSAAGFTRFLVAGGETSGAVVAALGVAQLRIGPEIDPGVPWTENADPARPMALALKSGNFGAEDFFLKAWTLIR